MKRPNRNRPPCASMQSPYKRRWELSNRGGQESTGRGDRSYGLSHVHSVGRVRWLGGGWLPLSARLGDMGPVMKNQDRQGNHKPPRSEVFHKVDISKSGGTLGPEVTGGFIHAQAPDPPALRLMSPADPSR